MKRKIVALIITGVMVAALTGCAKKETPAERAAKQFDKTMKTVGEKVEQAGKKIQEAAKESKK